MYAVEGKDVTYPNAADIALVGERSKKFSVSESATHSKAIRRFIKEKKSGASKSDHEVGCNWLVCVNGNCSTCQIRILE